MNQLCGSLKSAGALRRVATRAAVLAALGFASAAFGQVTGFGGNGTGWTLNGNTAGVPAVSSDTLTVTTAANSEASSAWFNTAQDITNFVASFTYTDVSTGGADGFTFTLQNAGTSAIGGGGGGMGFTGINSAAADVFSLYGGNGGSASQFNLATTGSPARTATTPAVDITTGHPINVTLSYRQADNAMVETLHDTSTNGTLTKVYRGIDLSSAVGGNTALIGFTGGTGGVNAQQTISNFSFTPGTASAAPVAAFKPVAATGYNQNMVMSASGGTANVTATIDGGTAKTGATFYEKGFRASDPNTGLPAAGQVFGSANDANHDFVLQPNGAGQNNAVMLDASNTTGRLTLADSTKAYSALSFLVAEGNGASTFTATIHFVKGVPDEVHTGIAAPDWFNGGPNIALSASGRGTLAGGFDSVGTVNPKMFQEDIALTDTTDPISSIDFSFVPTTGGDNRTAIFGLSGVAVPEPGVIGSLAVGLLALGRRRRA